MDCFVAEPVIGPAEGRTRWLLAMTEQSDSTSNHPALASRFGRPAPQTAAAAALRLFDGRSASNFANNFAEKLELK